MIKDRMIKAEALMNYTWKLWKKVKEYGVGSGYAPHNPMYQCYLEMWVDAVNLICEVTGEDYGAIIDEIMALHPEEKEESDDDSENAAEVSENV